MNLNRTPARVTLILSLVLLAGTLSGCAGVAPIAMRWVLRAGAFVLSTAVGHTIEVLLDKFFLGNDEQRKGADEVQIDIDDPLKGTYQGSIKITRVDKNGNPITRNGKAVKISLNSPKMVRADKQSPWKLAPESRQEVNALLEALEKKQE